MGQAVNDWRLEGDKTLEMKMGVFGCLLAAMEYFVPGCFTSERQNQFRG